MNIFILLEILIKCVVRKLQDICIFPKNFLRKPFFCILELYIFFHTYIESLVETIVLFKNFMKYYLIQTILDI